MPLERGWPEMVVLYSSAPTSLKRLSSTLEKYTIVFNFDFVSLSLPGRMHISASRRVRRTISIIGRVGHCGKSKYMTSCNDN